MSTREQDKARRSLEAVRNGSTEFTRTPEGSWMIVGPAANLVTGQTVTVQKADGTTTEVTVGEVTVDREVHGVAYRVAQIARPARTRQQAPTRHTYQRPRPDAHGRCHCDGDTDNSGRCYSCGGYVRSYDAGRTIRSYY